MFPPIQRDAAVGFTKVLPLPRHPVHPFPPITQLCGLVWLEESTSKLVCCDAFLQTMAVTAWFIVLAGRKKDVQLKKPQETSMTAEKYMQDW